MATILWLGWSPLGKLRAPALGILRVYDWIGTTFDIIDMVSKFTLESYTELKKCNFFLQNCKKFLIMFKQISDFSLSVFHSYCGVYTICEPQVGCTLMITIRGSFSPPFLSASSLYLLGRGFEESPMRWEGGRCVTCNAKQSFARSKRKVRKEWEQNPGLRGSRVPGICLCLQGLSWWQSGRQKEAQVTPTNCSLSWFGIEELSWSTWLE